MQYLNPGCQTIVNGTQTQKLIRRMEVFVSGGKREHDGVYSKSLFYNCCQWQRCTDPDSDCLL